ncbi:hypothetical protein ABID53_001538 [Bacillus oleivorans]|uniref:hypothetical protein n=1 Tax=Bacillus oleivorans TaxID=1448271 RepID=UPI0015CC787E|nr:hypothetical protein [Bacillus oleivorans]
MKQSQNYSFLKGSPGRLPFFAGLANKMAESKNCEVCIKIAEYAPYSKNKLQTWYRRSNLLQDAPKILESAPNSIGTALKNGEYASN